MERQVDQGREGRARQEVIVRGWLGERLGVKKVYGLLEEGNSIDVSTGL